MAWVFLEIMLQAEEQNGEPGQNEVDSCLNYLKQKYMFTQKLKEDFINQAKVKVSVTLDDEAGNLDESATVLLFKALELTTAGLASPT